MDIKLINIGFGNIVAANRIISIISPESAPIKRIIQEARDKGMLIDATYGRRTRAVVVTDSGHIILSAVQPETVANRLLQTDATSPPAISRRRSPNCSRAWLPESGIKRCRELPVPVKPSRWPGR